MPPPPPPSQSLDHLILFLPADPTTQLPCIPHFIRENFTLTPGGVHADGQTANTLVLLPDGCYVELICFTAPSTRTATHWWASGASRSGWKDWCLTNSMPAGSSWGAVCGFGEEEGGQGGQEGSHAAPIPGGRERPDGVRVQWDVTFPRGENGGQSHRGRVPFFCHDVTDRNVRVPLDAGEGVVHRSAVLGVAELTVVVSDKRLLGETREVYQRIFGAEGVQRGDEVLFRVGRVRGVEGLDSGARVVLRLPRDKDEFKRVEETGYWFGDVVLAALAGEGKTLGARERLDGGDESVQGLWVEYV